MSMFPRGAGSAGTGEAATAPAGERRLGEKALFGASAAAAAGEAPAAKRPRVAAGPAQTTPLEQRLVELRAGLGELALSRSGKGKKTTYRATMLNLSQYAQGAAVMGVVTSVTGRRAVIGLPGGVTGIVTSKGAPLAPPDPDAADEDEDASMGDEPVELDRAVEVGQVVRCVVLSNEASASLSANRLTTGKGGSARQKGRRRIELSLRPSVVNAEMQLELLVGGGGGKKKKCTVLCASVVAQEDHGCVVSLGVTGAATGFLKGATGGPSVGQLIDVSVVSVDGRAVIVKEAEHGEPGDKGSLAGLVAAHAMPWRSLAPGMAVEARVEFALPNGLLVSVLGGFGAVIDDFHLAPEKKMGMCRDPEPTAYDWSAAFPIGSVVPCRILVADPKTKSLRLTALPHLLRMRPLPSFFSKPTGAVVSDARIGRVGRAGLLLVADGPGGEEATAGTAAYWVTRDRMSDEERLTRDTSNFNRGDAAVCRVLGQWPLEGVLLASMKATTVAAPALVPDELRPSMVVSGIVKEVAEWGLKVEIAEGLVGLVQRAHLADAPLSSKVKLGSNQAFALGATLKCRVLDVDTPSDGTVAERTRPRVHLTHKPSLMADSLAPLCDYPSCTVGTVALGVVSQVKSFGVIVTFYGNVHGLVPASTLARSGISDPSEAYELGQLVKAAVVKCQRHVEPPRLLLSFDVARAASGATGGTAGGVMATPDVGTVVSGVVVEVKPHSLIVELGEGADSDDDDAPLPALGTLPKTHLGDSATHSLGMAACVRRGDVLDGLLVLHSGQHSALLTRKPLLLAAARRTDDDGEEHSLTLATDVSTLVPGQRLAGYVHRVEEFGVFLKFANNASALAPRALLTDAFVSDARPLFTPGDSVACRVVKVVDGKVAVSMQRSGEFGMGDPNGTRRRYADAWLAEEAAADEALHSEAALAWRRLAPGATSDAVVVAAAEDGGYVLRVSGADDADNVPLRLLVPSHHAVASKVGDAVKVRILDVDFPNRALVATMLPPLVTAGRKKRRRALAPLAVDAVADYEVQYVEPSGTRAIVASADDDRRLAVLLLSDYHAPRPDSHDLPAVGSTLQGTVLAPGEYVDAVTGRHPHAHSMLLAPVPQAASEGGGKKQRRRARSDSVGSMVDEDGLPTKYIKASKLVTGSTLRCLVSKITEKQMWLQLRVKTSETVRVRARVHITNCDRSSEAALAPAGLRADLPSGHPFLAFHEQQIITCALLTQRNVSDGDDEEGSSLELEMCVGSDGTATSLPSPLPKPLDWSEAASLKAGAAVEGIIEEVTARGVHVALSSSVRAFAHTLNLYDGKDADALRGVAGDFTVGTSLKCIIHSVNEERHRIELGVNKPSGNRKYKKGDLVYGIVKAYRMAEVDSDDEDAKALPPPPPYVTVELAGGAQARVPLVELDEPEAWCDSPLVLSDRSKVARRRDVDSSSRGFARSVGLLPADGSVVQCRLFGAFQAPARKSGEDASSGPKVPLFAASMRQSRLVKKKKNDTLSDDPPPQAGGVCRGFITSVSKAGAFVQVSRGMDARVMLRDLADWFVADPVAEFFPGRLVAGKVSAVDAASNRVELSLRRSTVVKSNDKLRISDYEVGMKVRGNVVRLESYGVFIRLRGSDGLTGLCHISECTDKYNKDLSRKFSPGDLVKVVVLKVDGKRISLGMKPSYFEDDDDSASDDDAADASDSDDSDDSDVDDVGEDMADSDDEVEAMLQRARKKTAAGDEDSDGDDSMDDAAPSDSDEEVEAMLRKARGGAAAESDSDGDDSMDEAPPPDSDEDIEILLRKARRGMSVDDGDVDEEGLRQKYADDEMPPDSDEEVERLLRRARKGLPVDASSDDEDEDEDEDEDDSDDEADSDDEHIAAMMDDSDDDGSSDNESSDDEGASAGPALGKASGMQWDDFSLGPSSAARADGSDSEGSDSEDSDSDDSDTGATESKRGRSSRKKAAAAAKDEASVRKRELELLDGDSHAPETVDDFERRTIASPNDSSLWVEYAVFQLSMANVEAARAVLERGLRTVVFREEKERLNLWVALINLEHKFGSKETLTGTVDRAAKNAHPKRVWLHVASVQCAAALQGSAADGAAAEASFEYMCKKFKTSKQVWTALCRYKLQAGDDAGARAVLKRSLLSLAPHKHVYAQVKLATFEYDVGSAERARTLFDTLIENNPKRTDLWHVYVDREVSIASSEDRQEARDAVRQARVVFKRFVGVEKLPLKTAKGVFKKWLVFEANFGDAATAAKVKAAAKSFLAGRK